ncbi:hypothetical protein E4U22_006472 [Claviceps purpurea]|nr:hypothetical protein E4U22_006472 [Claviceps purpurea]
MDSTDWERLRANTNAAEQSGGKSKKLGRLGQRLSKIFNAKHLHDVIRTSIFPAAHTNGLAVVSSSSNTSPCTLQRFIESLSLDKPDLDGVRELIQTLIHEDSRQSDIPRKVNEQLSANNQRTISLSTLQRNIRDWGFNQKTNQTDTNSVPELIQTRLANGDKPRQILEHVNTQRSARNECAITVRTLQ